MPKHLLSETLEYKDMVGIIKPTVHVDEFASKMGDDEDIIVVSFFVRNEQAAKDLVDWFEKGYDWILDADRSPGEIKPGRYLVFVEMRRRSTAGDKVRIMLDDLSTLTEHTGTEWMLTYENITMPFSKADFDRLVPLSPKAYRERKELSLNEMRVAAGLETKSIFDKTKDMIRLQSAAGF